MGEGESEGQGIFGSLRRLGQTAVGVLQNRLELFALELQEEKSWLVTVLLWSAAAIFFGGLTIVVITITVVMLCPEGARPWVLVGFSTLYLVLAVIAVVGLRRKLKNHGPPFSGSISEMKKDLQRLHSQE